LWVFHGGEDDDGSSSGFWRRVFSSVDGSAEHHHQAIASLPASKSVNLEGKYTVTSPLRYSGRQLVCELSS
jgi:hypothetical protein